LNEAALLATHEQAVEWWNGLVRLGREACARAAVLVAREGLGPGGAWDRFSGIPEEAWRVLEAFDAWFRDPTNERRDVIRALIDAAHNAPEPAQGVHALGEALTIAVAEDLAGAMAGFADHACYAWRRVEDLREAVREELLPWALGEGDRVLTRESEEGRHFGVDPDISRSVSFSPCGKFVLSSSRAGSVTIRSFPDGAIVRDFPRVRGEVFSARFSPDGKRVFATGQWTPSRLLDVATGEVIRELPFRECTDVAFVDDRRALAVGDWPSVVWDLETGAVLGTFEGKGMQGTKHVLVHGERAVLLSSAGWLEVFSLASGARERVLSEKIEAMVLSPDGRHLLVGGQGRIRGLAFPSGEEGSVFEGGEGSIYALAFTPTGDRFVSIHSARRTCMHLWDVETGRLLRTWRRFHALAFHAAFSPDGRSLVVGDRGGGLRVFVP
jgi:hypothetical protein